MMKKQWIVPVVVGMLSLSLVGCGYSDVEPMSEAAQRTQSMDGLTSTAANTPRTSADNFMRTGVSLNETGEEMVKNGQYHADGDGAIGEDGTQKGCKDCPRDHRMMDDVERAMHDVGRTMDSMRTDV